MLLRKFVVHLVVSTGLITLLPLNAMLKQLIKNIFSALGLEVRKKIHAPLSDSFSYNSQSNVDLFYSCEALLSAYISPQRISFYSAIIDEAAKHVNFSSIHTIADVSAGTGHLLKLFREKYGAKQYFGFEYSSKALEVCRKTCPGITFAQADLYKGVDQTFDLLLCVDTLEHLEYPEKAISNMLNMTNANGYILIAVPNGRYDTFEGHIHYWSPESLILFLKQLNCTITHSRVWNEFTQQCAIIQKK